ncbi:hypothetical protein TGARI_369560 [Toxoplasma gondii ARI]|uniref:Uncharacterized protein n=1 Tax=Toxoplasma gondii ARI TaxID=1074872 RepID=A0A139Y0V2_TOXGO|nr:hypothetical protein TGARI_369560 [Toxoplasma gondii ARI]
MFLNMCCQSVKETVVCLILSTKKDNVKETSDFIRCETFGFSVSRDTSCLSSWVISMSSASPRPRCRKIHSKGGRHTVEGCGHEKIRGEVNSILKGHEDKNVNHDTALTV